MSAAPTPLPHHVLEFIHVEGAVHFRDARLDFSDALNVIFGGRGTGKSGVIHFLRYALGVPVPAPHAKEHDEYVRDTLGAGQITLGLRTQHGVRYTVKRRYGEPPRVYAEDGSLAHVSLDGQLFKIVAYGQKRIEEAGRDNDSKLAILDQFAEVETRRIQDELARVERRMEDNATERARLAAHVEEDEAKVAELPSIAAMIKGLDLAGGMDPAEAASQSERKRARGAERRAMTGVVEAIEAARATLAAAAAAATRRLAAAAQAPLEQGPNGDAFRAANGAAQRAVGAIEESAGRLSAELSTFGTVAAAQARALAASHATEDDAYRAFVERFDADRARAAEREALHRRFEELSAAKSRLDERRVAQATLTAERDALRKEHGALVLALRACRAAVAAQINAALNGDVEVTVSDSDDESADEPYNALLTEMLRGSSIRSDVIKRIVAGIRPARLAALAEADDPGPIEAVDESKTDKPERARRILFALRASGRVAELERLRPPDVVRLALKVKGKMLVSEKVSVGERCTCVIPILLLASIAPLLIDQVEDHLDNAFVYHVLVKALLLAKASRQFIFVSHNPNIPALAKAERVFLLGVDDGYGHVAMAGSYVEMAKPLESWLEGGAEAFIRRGELYGHFPRRSP